MGTDPESILRRLTADLTRALGDDLLGLVVYGSWVAGDFAADRSDLDLLAVLSADPTERTLEVLAAVHRRIAEDHPAWAGRLDVSYQSAAAIAHARSRPRPMIRISPGEPLHLGTATPPLPRQLVSGTPAGALPVRAGAIRTGS